MTKSEFSEWFNELLVDARIMDVRYPVKGFYVWFPFGFTLRQRTYNVLRSLLDIDHQEACFPLLIPEHELLKESEHIKGFEDEVFWVTRGGSTKLDVPLALRPTSETAIYPMFSIWIRSHADLPLRVYQLVNTFRYETKHTRPLIRMREITSFLEAHTAHETWDDARRQTERAITLYQEFYDRLGVPYVVSRRPQWDKFPGADFTVAFDTLMPDGKSLQIGTIHHLGTNFSQTFDVTYEDRNGEQQYANQTCYGISERCLAALIAIHGDDRGLVLPPEVAPTQIVIIPIFKKTTDDEAVLAHCEELARVLSEYRVLIDVADERPGSKYYKWERQGVPIRLEVGPRDLARGSVTVVRRDTGEKERVPRDRISAHIPQLACDILANIAGKAHAFMRSETRVINAPEEAQHQNGMFKIAWCGSEACGRTLEVQSDADILGETEAPESRCPICNEPTRVQALLARPY